MNGIGRGLHRHHFAAGQPGAGKGARSGSRGLTMPVAAKTAAQIAILLTELRSASSRLAALNAASRRRNWYLTLLFSLYFRWKLAYR